MRLFPLALFLTASPALAGQIEIIVQREAQSLEIYFSLSAEDAPAFLGAGLESLTKDGTIPMDAIRTDGTAEAADAMIARTALTVDGTQAQLQAMSVMVHPKGTPFLFETPIDAQIAMSVCTAPDLIAGSTLSDLHAYAGYHAYPVDGFAPITIAPGGDTAREVRVSVFEDGVPTFSQIRTLGPGAPLELERAASPRPLLWPLMAMIVALAAAAALMRLRGRRASPA